MSLMTELASQSFLEGQKSEWYYLEGLVGTNLSAMSVLMSLLVFLGESDVVSTQLSKAVCWLSVMFFGAMSLLSLFIFFELVMAPILVMILSKGSQPEKLSAAHYALLYTSVLSLPFLGVLMVSEEWPIRSYPTSLGTVLYTGLFLVKSPLYTLHSWLPKAHVEAPTSGSMLLAGLLLKVGIYGAMKVMTLIVSSMHLVLLLSGVGMLLGSVACSVSSESKVLSAYSSVSHMNLGVYGLSTGASFLMGGNYILSLGHGYVSLLLFYLVGSMYQYTGTRMLHYTTGVLSFSGFLSVMVVGVLLSNAGVPPTLSFWSEALLISGSASVVMGVMGFLLSYFMLSLYYSLYMMVNTNKSGGTVTFAQETAVTCLWGLVVVLTIITVCG